MPRVKKPRKMQVLVFGPEEEVKGNPYRVLGQLVAAHHPHLVKAKIALAWNLAWNADADGHIRLGQAYKPREADRLLHGHDFIILLNRDVWHWEIWGEAEMAALLDHELCHCQRALDKKGEPVKDAKGRPVWRKKKHDVEEFQDVIERHGAWKKDLEKMCRAGLERKRRPLFRDKGVA